MTKRKFGKLLKRLKHLPKGFNLILYTLNKIKNVYLNLIKSKKVAYPSTIMLELTNHCNLNCITCPREYEFGKQMNKGLMNIDNLKKVVDEAYPYIDSIGLTGLGETFLYKDLEKVIEYIRNKSKGISISVSINSHVPGSPEIAKNLVNKINSIQISIDGLNETYNKIRVNGDFKIFHKNLKEIVNVSKKSTTDIMINIVVFEDNYFQLVDILKFADQEGIKYVNFTPMNLVGIPEIDISNYNFFETNEFNNELTRLIEESKKYPEIELTCPNFKRNDNFQICRYIWNYFYITWNGYIPPCCAKPFPKELNFGNVFQDGLLNTLNSPEFIEFRNTWLNNQTPSFCSRCY
ncbi:radical SAM protein [Bacteroidota bacterium]